MAIRVTEEDAPAPTDEALLERARRGEEDAFALVYRRHQASVYRFARAMTGSASTAEDVVQDVFVALMRDLDRFEIGRASLRSYLFGIARNVARYRARSLRRFLSLDVAEDWVATDDPVGDLSADEELRHLRRCLGALPTPYREVIVLCHLHELDYSEAASILAVPIGTVRSRLHRGRQMLLDRFRRRDKGHSSVAAINRCVI
jgi:RNA polymerase sigma factor (sigma-70 family)